MSMNGRVIRRWFVFALLVWAVLTPLTIGKEYTADYWIQQGNEFYNKGSYEIAIDCYNKSIELDSQNAVSLTNKGLALGHQGKYNESIKCYDQAIKIDPQYADAWFNKGNALRIIGEYNESIKAYENAIKINPIHVGAWNNKDLRSIT